MNNDRLDAFAEHVRGLIADHSRFREWLTAHRSRRCRRVGTPRDPGDCPVARWLWDAACSDAVVYRDHVSARLPGAEWSAWSASLTAVVTVPAPSWLTAFVDRIDATHRDRVSAAAALECLDVALENTHLSAVEDGER